ncbi:GH3 auxin-responsive promoter [Scleroderma citrinum]
MSSCMISPLTSLTSELKAVLQEDTSHHLRCIIGTNITTRYASSSPVLSDFRRAAADKNLDKDVTVVDDFRRLVPLTDYESYRPFVAKFLDRPCKMPEVENLLAPGLPTFICVSSSTSSNEPKRFPKYPRTWKTPPVVAAPPESGTVASIFSLGYKDLLEVLADSGEIALRIPVSPGSVWYWRTYMNWSVETDATRMTTIVPNHVVPWAASLITHHRPFMLMHALFALADTRVEQIHTTFITLFVDLLHRVQEDWGMLVSSIRDGTIPDIEHIHHVRSHLQDHMHANPQRAEELQGIGPPLSCPAWAERVWPNLKVLTCICSGTFSTAVPKARTVLGPNVAINSPGYICTEGLRGTMLNVGDTETFFFDTEDVLEFLDVMDTQTHRNIVQRWEVQPGRLYQPVFTSQDGLWRYLIDDVVQIIGFDPRNGSPVFRYCARKNLAIRLYYAMITEADLVKVIQAINRQDMMEVHEFTTALDQRELPATVGLFVEITGDLGLNAHLSREKAFEALVTTNYEHQAQLNFGGLRLPTIRILKHGTFMEYRQWRGESMNVGVNQLKVPVVMWDPNALAWLIERVVREV